jgi:hypothetical protein
MLNTRINKPPRIENILALPLENRLAIDNRPAVVVKPFFSELNHQPGRFWLSCRLPTTKPKTLSDLNTCRSRFNRQPKLFLRRNMLFEQGFRPDSRSLGVGRKGYRNECEAILKIRRMMHCYSIVPVSLE